MTRLAVVMPCYNEEETLRNTLNVILSHLDSLVAEGRITQDSYILCVDDGSKDRTWALISEAHTSEARIKGISLAHNRGQQSALVAGMETVTDRCDACVTIDADLQDDPAAIAKMLSEFDNGAEIVFGQRSSRDTDTWMKRNSALAFYRLQRTLSIESIDNHAEFRLMSNRALHLLAQYGESNLYLRGVVAQLGLKQAIVTYPRAARTAGTTKYSYAKLLSLSVDGITSFTAKPMRLIFNIGLLLLVVDIVVAIWALLSYLSGKAVTGWTSIILSVWFLGSLILIALGIVGEYIGKIYIEVKHRPRYAIRERLFD